VREHNDAFTEGIQDGLHEVAFPLEATGENRQVLRIEVIDAA
jgi:hypothetical protein